MIILVRPLKRVQVKGRKTEFMIYELLALRASDDPELRIRDRDEQLSAMTYDASHQYSRLAILRRQSAPYRAILDNFPRDPVARFMLKECEECRAADLPIPPGSARNNRHATLNAVPNGFRHDERRRSSAVDRIESPLPFLARTGHSEMTGFRP